MRRQQRPAVIELAAGRLDSAESLADDGLIAADNTLWSGQVLDERATSDDTVALRRFNDAVVADERVVCAQLTVRDGVTLIRKRGG